MPSLLLRALNPKSERDLFRESYNWRNRPRKDRLSFEDFAADDPNQIVLGLFNGELLAVYFFHQIGPNSFQAHFTSHRKADKALVLAGARQLVEWFRENNLEMVAYIAERNWPLRRFVEAAGLQIRKVSDSGSLPSTTKLFVEYGAQVNPHRVER